MVTSVINQLELDVNGERYGWTRGKFTEKCYYAI